MIHPFIRHRRDPMTKLNHLQMICLLVVGLLSTTCTHRQPAVSQQNANTAAPQRTTKISAEQLAQAYGLNSFGQVEAIRDTWNAQFPGVNVSRSWVWEPKTGKVSYEGKDKDGKPVKATYNRS